MNKSTHCFYPRAVGVIVLLLGGGTIASAGVVVSNFNSSGESWTLGDSDPSSSLTYFATGGNPGGYILFTDAAQGANDVFSAPAKFLGDDSGFMGGTLSFDLAHNEPADDITISPLVIFGGTGDTLSLIIAAPATSSNPYTWSSYNIALNTGAGFVFDGGTNSANGFNLSGGTAATLGDISVVLGNVTGIFVPADMHNGTEVTGLDNFALTSVPEPATWSILAGGAAAVWAFYRRRVGKSTHIGLEV